MRNPCSYRNLRCEERTLIVDRAYVCMQWEGLRSLDGHLIDTNSLHSQVRASFPPERFLETSDVGYQDAVMLYFLSKVRYNT